ncbi:amino acid transporter heavy chain SLC3A2-like [Conger conger]|uniref:amino acid transporter heavy chain SLC3A2-like n=1 Tax=Conger conger TaxID=82655 RepID=UPI002A5AAF94|nr:amino acid transporter heavy chain SLC3A2-like [Conger conger]XP_061090787.1 amino acid transporter heavy chain SLC3A2-like [Conger conger]
MSKDSAVDMKDVELNELDLEKQPMTGGEVATGGTEKNGFVKVEEADVKFTGLSKEELMKVAGTPGWVRTRWILLVLFWLGWLGMLAGAIVIIVQAPRCKPIPKMDWWNEGPIYQIWDVDAFSGADGLKGLEDKLDSLGQLKVKGLVLGPLHTVQSDQPETVDFKSLAPEIGTKEQFESFVGKAHKKGMSVVLDMTPNYRGSQPWFNEVNDVTLTAEKLKDAIPYWFQIGVDGIQVAGLDQVSSEAPAAWTSLREVIQANRTEGEKNKALIGLTSKTSGIDVAGILEDSGVDLILSGVLKSGESGSARAQDIQQLYIAQNQTSLAWSLGGRNDGHLATLVGAKLVRLYQLLLFTLPGTPVFSYGDEIGLMEQGGTPFPKMLWDSSEPEEEKNETLKSEREQRLSFRSFFKTLSDLRGKERSLLHGDFLSLHNDTTSLAFLRQWDQSGRYIAAVNWGDVATTLRLVHPDLPAEATVELSTDPIKLVPESSANLGELVLEGQQAVLLQFPFTD